MAVASHSIRVVLPQHLRTLARVGDSDEISVEVAEPVTMNAVVTAIEAEYPMLRGTIRDHRTRKRRDFVRFFACGEDVSLESAELELPAQVVNGAEPFLVVGAIAGG